MFLYTIKKTIHQVCRLHPVNGFLLSNFKGNGDRKPDSQQLI